MKLEELLNELAAQLSPHNKVEIRIIFSALSRPEYFYSSNNGLILSKIDKLASKHVLAAEVLRQVNALLMEAFRDNVKEYGSGNRHYDLINNFFNKIEEVAAIFLTESLKDWLTAAHASYTGLWKDAVINPEVSLEDAIKVYERTYEEYQKYRLGEIHNLICTLEDEKTRSDLYQKLYEIISGLFIFRTAILGVCARKMESLSSYVLIYDYVQQAREEMNDLLFTDFFSGTPEFYNLIAQNIATVEKYFFAVWSNLKFSNINDDEKHYENPNNLHRLGKGEMVSWEKPPAKKDRDPLFQLIQPQGLSNPKQMFIDMIGMPQILRENTISLLQLSQYDACAPVMWKRLQKQRRLPTIDEKRGHLLASFYFYHSIQEVGSGLQHEESSLANFIYFFNKNLATLKELTLNEISENKEYLIALTQGIEITILILWQIANDKYIDVPSIMGGITIDMRVINENHDAVFKQRLLTYMAELVSQLLRFDNIKFESPFLLVALERDFNETEKNKLNGLYGLFDILLNRINAYDKEIASRYRIKDVPKALAPDKEVYQPSAAEMKEADERCDALLAELENEKSSILRTAKNAVGRQRENHKIKVSQKAKSNFFEEKSAPIAVSNIKPEVKEYFEIGRLRQTGAIDMDKAIIRYQNLIIPLEQDSFYLAATLAELSDCHVRKALAEIKENFFSGDRVKLKAMIDWCEVAVQYAKQADICFVTQVTALSVTDLKEYEDLASHIHDILSSANDRLNFLQGKFTTLIANIEKSQEALDKSRQEAIYRFGGILKWRANSTPNNYHAVLRKKQNEDLHVMKYSVAKIQSCMENSFKPVKADFAYLAGKASLPLLSEVATSQVDNLDENALSGRGEFKERLLLLAKSWEILTLKPSAESVSQLLSVGSEPQPRLMAGLTM